MSVMIVTGGSRGIGAATSILAAQRGYSVAVNYRTDQQAALSVVDTIKTAGGNAFAVAADVSVEQDVQRLFDKTQSTLGNPTVLVNNAAVLKAQSQLRNMTAARINQVLQTNVLGTLLCAREAINVMATDVGGKGGCIINVSSIAARFGAPNEYIDYAASKGAIDTFTRGLASEVASVNIRVNAVSPGVIYTDIHASGGEPDRVERIKTSIPMQRGGQPEEVAMAIVWLASDEASYITGSSLDVSGGR